MVVIRKVEPRIGKPVETKCIHCGHLELVTVKGLSGERLVYCKGGCGYLTERCFDPEEVE